jgi:hypothetical protein
LKSVDLGVKVSTGAVQTIGAGFTRNSVDYRAIELLLPLALTLFAKLGTGFPVTIEEGISRAILPKPLLEPLADSFVVASGEQTFHLCGAS